MPQRSVNCSDPTWSLGRRFSLAEFELVIYIYKYQKTETFVDDLGKFSYNNKKDLGHQFSNITLTVCLDNNL